MHGEHREGETERIAGVPEPLPCANESPAVKVGAYLDGVGFDIETSGLGPDDIITVACAWSREHQAHCFHGEDWTEVVGMLDAARYIYTFNGVEFDLPRFAKHCGLTHRLKDWILKTVDPLYLMKHTLGYGACAKLNDVLTENGFEPKSGSGLQAIQFWNDGNRDALVAYCMDDCRLSYLLCVKDEILWAKRWKLRLGQARVVSGFQ